MVKTKTKAKTKTREKRKTQKVQQLSGIKAAIISAWSVYRRYWWLIVRVGVLSAFIHYILNALSGGDSTLIISQLWFTVMLAVFVWLASQLSKGKTPVLGEVFYKGSATFIKQLFVLAIWLVYLIPFMIGASLAVHVSAPLFGANTVELILVNLVWLSLGVISGYWIARSLFAPFHALEYRPVRATKESWKSTKKLVSRIVLRLFTGFLLALLPVTAVIGLTFFSFWENQYWLMVMAGVFELTVFSFTFPFLVIYINEIRPYGQPAKARPKTKK